MGPEERLQMCVGNEEDSTYTGDNKLCINEMTNRKDTEWKTC